MEDFIIGICGKYFTPSIVVNGNYFIMKDLVWQAKLTWKEKVFPVDLDKNNEQESSYRYSIEFPVIG